MKRNFYSTQSVAKLFLCFLLLTFTTGMFAQATLSVQGVLTKSDGTAVDDDTYTVNFRLFDAETGGNQVHSEPIDVETIGGVYSVILGKNPAYPMNAPFNTIYYLSVKIGSQELLPRPQITHAPYALSLLGQNNKFPSTGLVIADAIKINGNAEVTGNETLNGSLSVGNGLTVSNGQTINGASNIQNGQTVNGGQTVNNSQTVNDGQTVNGPLNVNNPGNALNVATTYTNASKLLVTNSSNNGGGYAFNYDYDSGMFGVMDGEFLLKANGVTRILFGANGTNYINSPGATDIQNTLIVDGLTYLNNVPDFDGKNMQWNATTHLVGADNSTRRAKFNIKNLEDDFSLILKAQPRTYTRKVDPNHWEVGYIAEEMDSIGLKKLVEYDENGLPDGYNYEKMILYVTEVVKMQHTDIEKLQAEVAALKAENAQLNTENTTLRTDNGNLQQQQTVFSTQLEALTKRMNSLENARAENNRK